MNGLIRDNKTYILSKDELINLLIREYNEEIHVGTTLEEDELYSLDEFEIEDFLKWINKNL